MKKPTFIVATAIVFVSLIALSILHGTAQYERASRHVCDSPTASSTSCVTNFTTQVTRLDSRITRTCFSYGGCSDDPVPLTGVVFDRNSQSHTLWFRGAPREATPGKMIEVSAWRGHYTGIVDRGKWRESYYWEPGFMKWTFRLALTTVLAALLILLIGQLRLRRHARMMDSHMWVIYCILGVSAFISLMALMDDGARQFVLWL